jgi:hypothetical protein
LKRRCPVTRRLRIHRDDLVTWQTIFDDLLDSVDRGDLCERGKHNWEGCLCEGCQLFLEAHQANKHMKTLVEETRYATDSGSTGS